MKKENNNLRYVIAVLCVLVVALISYIIVQKVKLSNAESNSDIKNNTMNNIDLTNVYDENNYPTKKDDKATLIFNNEDEDGTIVEKYKYNDYIITIKSYSGGADISSIVITDSNENILYQNNEIKSGIGKNLEDKAPIISNGNLYFFTVGKDCYAIENGEKIPYIEYNFIDLNSDKINVSTKSNLKLYVEGEYHTCNN